VIGERIGRLAEPAREALRVASVEGEGFTAEVVARVLGADEREMVRQLSRLDREHRLVSAQGMRRVGSQRLSVYRFRHTLFQRYVYNGLGEGERAYLHEDVGTALEALYGEGAEEIAVQLARHFQEAGIAEKAVDYLSQVGDRARGLYAHQEAIDYYQQALAFLKEQGEHERAARTVMKLGLTYHTAFDFQSARQAYNEGFALWQRAGEVQPTIPPSPAPHALRMVRQDPPTLDLTMADESTSGEVIFQLFSGLVEKSPKMEAVPDVARSWEVSQDGKRYVFYLRDDARWSDGVPVTAGDFEYAWRRALDPVTGSPVASLLYDIKGARPFHQGEVSDPDSVRVQALDDLTLVVELEGPAGYFLHLLTHSATFPIPRHVVEARGETWAEIGSNSTESDIITNGPFRLEAWNRGESMVLARNPRYHGRFTGNLERVELSLLPLVEWSARLGMYEADNLDILRFEGLPPSERDRARQRYAGEYVSVPELNTYYVGFDVSRPPFDDPRVRQAFVLATDREMLAGVVLRGYEFPATGGLIPPGVPGHSARIGLPYDPEQARQLLAEAGYPGGRGFPVVDPVTWRRMKPRSEYLQAQWRENLGVEITWEAMEFEMFLDRMRRGLPSMFLFGWRADYPDPDNFLRASPIRRYTGWQNEVYDRLVEEARRVMNQRERMKLYGQADRILVEEAAIMPIIYSWSHLLVKPWVTKFPASPSDMWFWKDVIIEPH
jgi:oligopeptide transport system substrate-binding protein